MQNQTYYSCLSMELFNSFLHLFDQTVRNNIATKLTVPKYSTCTLYAKTCTGAVFHISGDSGSSQHFPSSSVLTSYETKSPSSDSFSSMPRYHLMERFSAHAAIT